VGRFFAALVLAVTLTSCTSPFAGPPPPSPLPSPTPHTPVASTLLQQADLTAPLQRCTSSGSMDDYIQATRQTNAGLAIRLATQWAQLKAAGANDGAISLFAADTSACSQELAAAGNIQSAASLVIAFGDEGEADRAWQAGIFGFAPPVPGELPPGVERGAGTGLGPSSWTYDRAPVRLACWRKKVFVALVVFTNVDATAFKAGAAAIDARLT
jgi:hypothetical protein